MTLNPVDSGYFEHTRQAKLDRAAPRDKDKSRPWIAPRVALDVLLLPVNLTLGTVANYIERGDSRELFCLPNGKQLTAVQLGTLGLVNKGVDYGFRKLFFGLGITAGVATTPVALLAGKQCKTYVLKAGACGAKIGAMIGYITGSIGEAARAAARWAITHPHYIVVFLLMLAAWVALAALLDKGFKKAGVSDDFARGFLTARILDGALATKNSPRESYATKKLTSSGKQNKLSNDSHLGLKNTSDPLTPTSVEVPESDRDDLSNSGSLPPKMITSGKERSGHSHAAHAGPGLNSPPLTATITELPDSDSESGDDSEQSAERSTCA